MQVGDIIEFLDYNDNLVKGIFVTKVFHDGRDLDKPEYFFFDINGRFRDINLYLHKWSLIGHDPNYTKPDKNSILPKLIEGLRSVPFAKRLDYYREFQEQYPYLSFEYHPYLTQAWGVAIVEVTTMEEVLANLKYWQYRTKFPKEIKQRLEELLKLDGKDRLEEMFKLKRKESTKVGSEAFDYWMQFQDIESFKVSSSGIEYKKAQENAKKANEVLESQREAESVRLNILKALSSPNMQISINELIKENVIQLANGTLLIYQVMKATILSSLDIEIDGAVVSIIDGKPHSEQYQSLNVNFQLLVNEIVNEDKPWIVKNGKRSYMAIQIKWDDKYKDYCILCLEANSLEWCFCEADYTLITTAWNIVKNSIELCAQRNLFRDIIEMGK